MGCLIVRFVSKLRTIKAPLHAPTKLHFGQSKQASTTRSYECHCLHLLVTKCSFRAKQIEQAIEMENEIEMEIEMEIAAQCV
jgi:hypothetical protein